MPAPVGIDVNSHDFALTVDPKGISIRRARKINLTQMALAQQEAVDFAAGVDVIRRNVTFRIDGVELGEGRARKVDGAEGVVAQQKTVPLAGGVLVSSDDLAPCVDFEPIRRIAASRGGAGEIDRNERV